MMSKSLKEKGKMSLDRFFQIFKVGDRVVLKAESAFQKGLYHPRFHGKSGLVQKKTGRCYEILISDQGKQKTVVTYPIHMKKS